VNVVNMTRERIDELLYISTECEIKINGKTFQPLMNVNMTLSMEMMQDMNANLNNKDDIALAIGKSIMQRMKEVRHL